MRQKEIHISTDHFSDLISATAPDASSRTKKASSKLRVFAMAASKTCSSNHLSVRGLISMRIALRCIALRPRVQIQHHSTCHLCRGKNSSRSSGNSQRWQKVLLLVRNNRSHQDQSWLTRRNSASTTSKWLRRSIQSVKTSLRLKSIKNTYVSQMTSAWCHQEDRSVIRK